VLVVPTTTTTLPEHGREDWDGQITVLSTPLPRIGGDEISLVVRQPIDSPRSKPGGLSKQNFWGRGRGYYSTKGYISYQQKFKAVDDRPLHPSRVAEMRMKEI
jgi:hypothetical protein